MGRPRTTGCTERHWPGERCGLCARVRARRSRRRRKGRPSPTPAVAVDAEREALDKQAAEHRTKLTQAYTKISHAIRRGTIAPPTACERCGLPAEVRLRMKLPAAASSRRVVRELHAWLPDPAEPTAIAWLCTACRKLVRATREPLVLRWVWPGPATAPRKGRPRKLAEVAAQARTARGLVGDRTRPAALRGFTELADRLFFHALINRIGERAEALYAQGLRAALRGIPWAPLGEPELDAQLRRWVVYERERREADLAESEGRAVTPVDAWERRRRRDLLPSAPRPLAPARPIHPFDEHGAIDRLAAAEADYAAILDRIAAAVERKA
jgi:hypothetical protein